MFVHLLHALLSNLARGRIRSRVLRTIQSMTRACDICAMPLCSIGVFRYLVAPAVRHLLEAGLHTQLTAAPVEWLLSSFELLYNALWLFPAYVISLIVNTLWCV